MGPVPTFFTQTRYFPPSIGMAWAPPVLTVRGPVVFSAFSSGDPVARATKGEASAPAAATWAARNDRREIVMRPPEIPGIVKPFRAVCVFFLGSRPPGGEK